MIITNKLKLDLQNPGTTPNIHAVQNDSYSRNLEIALLSGNRPFSFPENLAVVIRYRKSDGKGGEYDTLPDGTTAWWICQNRLTIALAPQVLTTPGSVLLSVTLLANGTQLSIFPVRLSVDPIAAAKLAKSEDYFYINGLLPAPAGGKVGQYLQISSVNEAGRITAVEAVDQVMPLKGIDYWTDTDREEILQDLLSALQTPVFGCVDESNNIILSGELPDGTYTLKYEDCDGNLTEIGTLTHSNANDPDDGDPYVNLADPSGDEWLVGYRLNSSAKTVEADGGNVTNFIPCQTGDFLRIKGLHIGFGTSTGTRSTTYFYAEDKTTIVAKATALDSNYQPPEGWTSNADFSEWTHTVGEGPYTLVNGTLSDIRYARFSCLLKYPSLDDVIITKNQEIV